jgi:peptide/nickel transport system ATP-binding protein
VTPPLLRLDAASRHFALPRPLGRRIAETLRLAVPAPVVRAVDGVSIEVHRGEVVGLVGESGCGKSTVARLACGLLPATAGRIDIDGQPLALDDADRRRRARIVQMVFQDPMSSLNPRRTVAQAVLDGPRAHGLLEGQDETDSVIRALADVGLDAALAHRLPHQLSGGQRQRVGIARALALQPRLLVCDEAVAALDVSVQAQVLNLLAELRASRGLAYLFISHDLGVVRHLADRVVVMYLGRVVEEGPVEAIFGAPQHPYTQALVAETDRIERGRRVFVPLVGEVPSPARPPPGCHFHPRCPKAAERCRTEPPVLHNVGAQQRAACHFAPTGAGA